MYVVLHHTLPHAYSLGGIDIGWLIRFGQEAVILFFLLSGFVINYSYRQGVDKSFKRYFQSRFYRIYIPLVIVLFLGYLNTSYNNGRFINPELKTLAGNLLMLQDWSFVRPNVIVDTYLDNVPLWSLSYEWWFYMLFFPIVNLGVSRAARDRWVFGLCIAAAIAYTVLPEYFVRVFMYLAIWWVGVRLADAYIDNGVSDLNQFLLPLATISAISCVLGFNAWQQAQSGTTLTFGRHPIIELRHFGFAGFAIVVALLMHRTTWQPFDWVTRPFLYLAPISYALYIVHGPLARQGTYLDFLNNSYLEWIGYLAVCLLVSYAIELKIYPKVKRRFMVL